MGLCSSKPAFLQRARELASSDECAVVVSVAKVQAQEGVGHAIVPPGSPNVAAKIEPGPTEERRRYIDRRRIDRRRGGIRRDISSNHCPRPPPQPRTRFR